MKQQIMTIAFLLMACNIIPQDTTKQNNAFTWSIFADTYYSNTLDKPQSHVKQSFLYNHNRHNQFNLNLGLIKASYNTERVRANVGLMAGTYAKYNLAAEQELLRHIYEANAGVKI